MDLSSHIQHSPVNRELSVVSVLQPTSQNTPINNRATRSRSPWAPRRPAWTIWAPVFSWEFSATLTCSCRTNGRSTCARLIPAYQRKGVRWCQQKLICAAWHADWINVTDMVMFPPLFFHLLFIPALSIILIFTLHAPHLFSPLISSPQWDLRPRGPAVGCFSGDHFTLHHTRPHQDRHEAAGVFHSAIRHQQASSFHLGSWPIPAS